MERVRERRRYGESERAKKIMERMREREEDNGENEREKNIIERVRERRR